jgi:hypothetical protein
MIRLLIATILLIAPASALVISQGDSVYLNETHDITLAVSYPTYQVAWCAAGNADCDPPDQVIDTEQGNLEKYWIDPTVFKIGTYYRWDGEWHPAENAVAFIVKPGKRPVNLTRVNNTTVKAADEPVLVDGPFHYIVPRGDASEVYTVLNSQTLPCHLWVFSNTLDTYNLPMGKNQARYSYHFTEAQSLDMSVGEYSGYIQCDGRNEWQDIYLDGNILDTPYDNNKVPDVTIEEWNLLNAKRQFDELKQRIPRFDDDLTPITVSVVDPSITISSIEQGPDKLWISGTTTWGNNSPITLKLDHDNYKLSADIALHTWKTFATGSIDAPRTFATAISLNKEELAIGIHEITAKADRNANTAVSSLTFMVSDVYVMPTPTPETKRMIYGKDWEVIPQKIEPTPEPTENLTETWGGWVTITPEPETNATPTPNTTATTIATTSTTAIPTAEKTIPTIPLDPLVVAGAIAFIAWRKI